MCVANAQISFNKVTTTVIVDALFQYSTLHIRPSGHQSPPQQININKHPEETIDI